ncbi:MAG: magnesium and cobalt transport protein CorA [Methylococcales bacterium]
MLINCVAYQEGKKLKDISIAEISDYLLIPDCFVWVALQDAGLAELETMREEFDFHVLAVEDAWHSHHRPKIEEYGEAVFAVMHLIEMEENLLNVGEVDIFVGLNYVLSVRNRSHVDFLGVRARCEREPHLLSQGAGFVFYALMDAVVDRYFPVLDALETELENIEEHIFVKGSARSNIERLYVLKRKVMVLKHAVAPMMETSGKLYRGRVPKVCTNTQEYFRDVYDHLNHINASIDTIRDTIGTAIQVNLSMVTIEESEVTKRLAAWAGIFGVATAFAGIWGMNFEVMPELHWQYGYPSALILIMLVCVILYRRSKKAGWL